ncbi:orotidine-5'-phosphate decarboxylase [Zavarzinia sp. CC-PAN008]|uniref:orotidine-5'-phosphate decarboxylase n=1 Tax=Zavarzinia sp. CC-PAN008 TaxID=3243332 RepID=UPI003F74A32B
MSDPRAHLCVALDLPDVGQARALVAALRPHVGWFKIGHQLIFAGGLDLAAELAEQGARVFLDAKLYDIGETVANGVGSIRRLGAQLLTVEGNARTVSAAVAARGDSGLRILAVTVLTDRDQADLAAEGLSGSVADLVERRARASLDAGADGLICSTLEIERLRALAGPGRLLVVPGIRPEGTESGGQKRIATPAAAIRAGADILVVGRPITRSPDPAAAAAAIVAEIAAA